jgi:hypothetical protein
MKRYFLLAAICLATLTANAANAQTGLGEVFGQKTQTEETTDSPVNLGETFTDAGFELDKSKPDSVAFFVKKSGINYPVVAYLTESKTFVWIQINLNKLPENSATHATHISTLMTYNGIYGPYFYSVGEKSGMIALLSAMRIDSINAENVKDQVEGMIVQLDAQIEDWDTSKWTVKRHIGSWSTSLGDDSTMVINLRSDGTFDLTNRADSQVTSISGNYILDNGMLKMKDDQGNEIMGNIQFVDGNHFKLEVNDQSLEFERG